MSVKINERRGLNREDAIQYLGIKGSAFDKEIRPLLHPKKFGTSLIFDRKELDIIFDTLMLSSGDVGPTEKGLSPWPKKPQAFLKHKMDAGALTKPTKANDFKDALKHLRQRKSG